MCIVWKQGSQRYRAQLPPLRLLLSLFCCFVLLPSCGGVKEGIPRDKKLNALNASELSLMIETGKPSYADERADYCRVLGIVFGVEAKRNTSIELKDQKKICSEAVDACERSAPRFDQLIQQHASSCDAPVSLYYDCVMGMRNVTFNLDETRKTYTCENLPFASDNRLSFQVVRPESCDELHKRCPAFPKNQEIPEAFNKKP